ncbi:MAG TPA: aminopeptidase P family protein [Acholeplasmataceae bacterium]|nr:aminopeptidase P family protein [Acholeplasmataceae bacterium]
MNKQFFINNRLKYLQNIEDNSITVMFSGGLIPWTGDQDYTFEINKNFYYLTGINQENVIFVLVNGSNGVREYLFIEENDELTSKWVGKKLTIDEAKEISGIKEVLYLNEFNDLFFNILNGNRKIQDDIKNIYLDLERKNNKDYFSRSLNFCQEFRNNYPEIKVFNNYHIIVSLRMIKTAEEVEKIKESINTTKIALENVMRNLAPNLYEYQIETFFDSAIKYHGNKDKAFETICASGKNATILHYVKNDSVARDGDLILFDLGCRTNFYVSDISRTYPVNGKFTNRQKEVYQVVLECNKKCIQFLKPGVTWDEFNKYANNLLVEGLKKLGKINDESELTQYYWHSIGHFIGLDTHDPGLRNVPFKPGMVLTVEPGLYLEDENIGIRIEDNVLITEDGALNLSKDIIKEIEDIENFMKKSV